MLAHVPDLKSFVAGMKILLAPTGVVSVEFPHLEQLVDGNQFDTIYHEHYSYFSFAAARRAFATAGLTVFDVEEFATMAARFVCSRVTTRISVGNRVRARARPGRTRTARRIRGDGRLPRLSK